MIRCIAVDDEKPALDLLVDNIRQLPYLKLEARCRNAFEATEALQTGTIDLIFLDVQMPGMSGLQFIKSMVKPPMVILVTAYEQYALDGFDLDVVDYLVKPVALERFVKACNKAKALYELRAQGHQESGSGIAPFFVHVEYRLVKIIPEKILYIEGLKDYVKIYPDGGDRPVITRMTMKAILEKLPSNLFVRIHKSFIVSIPRVTAIKRDYVMIGTIEVPIGESHKVNVSRILGDHST